MCVQWDDGSGHNLPSLSLLRSLLLRPPDSLCLSRWRRSPSSPSRLTRTRVTVCGCFRQKRARGKALSRRAWACVRLCKPAVAVALVVAMVRVAAVAVVVAVALATIGPLFFFLLLRELRLEHGSPPAGRGGSVR